jgi:alkanesulfonate monooxygenase SsuD/methylene tetrahydromethanopterin reductase-like flavin-dependent oxidoreductase (luciferase family)
MFHAANLPIIGEFADPTLLAELAGEAEHAGWDGVFVWDTLLFDVEAMPPVLDPWAMLAVIATSTTHVKIGPMIAPTRPEPSRPPPSPGPWASASAP